MPGQEELTGPYVDRYFAEIGATGAFRSGWAMRDVAAKAYPRLAATPATLRRAEQTLAGDLPGPIRRALLDGTDKLSRAVRSLARFGSGCAPTNLRADTRSSSAHRPLHEVGDPGLVVGGQFRQGERGRQHGAVVDVRRCR